MARMNIDLDETLVREAMRLTGARTMRDVVDIALRRLVAKGSLYRAALRMKGGAVWDGAVDTWRSSRTKRS